MSEKANVRVPLCHVVQRTGLPAGRQAAYRLLAVLLALVTGGIFLLCLGLNPFSVYGTMLTGSLGTKTAFREMVKVAIPLCITSLGITLAFKMKFWNIGAEGQICVGAIAGSFFAYTFAESWPSWLLLLTMAAAGFVAGGLWGMIPAYFKTKWGTNETLFTLMLNYVALYFIQFLREGPWRDPKSMGFPIMPRFDKAARMPMVEGIHIGWIVALVLVVAVFLYLRFSKQGYELTVVGENMQTARYAGMPVKKIVLRTMFLSAGICGLAGILQASGADKQLTDSVAGGVGFTAITVAWLSQLSPFGILIVSLLFGILEKGSGTVESAFKVSPSMADVLQGIILFFVLGAEFFIRYQIKFREKSGEGGESMTAVLDWVSTFLYAAILAGVPLLFGTLGEILTEKAGNINLGVEGMMYMGAVFGFMGGYYFESVAAVLLLAILGGMLGAALYAFLTVTLKANQNVTGLTLTIFGTGLANLLGTAMINGSATGAAICTDAIKQAFRPVNLGALTQIPYIGKLIFGHSLFTYLAVALAIAAGWYVRHTPQGLNLRAVGENPAAADAAGVNVSMYKYVHIIVGGGICGLGGAYISMVTCGGNWTYNCVGGLGWIAVALVIFAAWSPYQAILGSMVFGALSVLRLYIPTSVVNIPSAFFSMVPFVATCVILVISSIRQSREKQQPQACGINYFREER